MADTKYRIGVGHENDKINSDDIIVLLPAFTADSTAIFADSTIRFADETS
jgi:type III secretory pathway component EscR